MKRILIWFSFALTGCVAEIGLPEAEDRVLDEAVEVVLDISGCIHTKSSLYIDEYELNDLSLAIYRNGLLESSEYVSSAVQSMKVRLMEGHEYNVYVMANAGEIPVFATEEEFREKCLYSIQEISDLKERLPMAWSGSDINVYEGMEPIDVQLERLAAKITFTLDKDILEGLRVTSARLCQCASVVRPFKNPKARGSRVEIPSELIAGDEATAEDLADLNSGKTMVFYTLENCQGVLLPDNASPAGKVPEELGQVAGLCTYLEVKGVFDGEGFLDGEVMYRFYLGLDAISSFDVPGNACIDVMLQLTGMGLHEVSWRVDADVSVREGYAWGSVVKGLHDVDDLYVGEKLLYRVEVSDEILSYVGGDASVCSLWLDSVQGAMEFSELVGEGNDYTCEIACRACADGKLFLLGPDGERLATLSQNVSISPPVIVFSEDEYDDGSGQVESFSYVPQCIVNGGQEKLYVYLTDSDRRNLNSSAAYGFDLETFDLSVYGIEGYDVLNKFFLSSFLSGTERSDGYAAALVLSCRNDGKDADAAAVLAEVYGNGRILKFLVGDTAVGFSGKCGVGIGIQPITLTLVDNGWAGHHSTQLSVRVDNKSEMPLEILVCQMVDNNNAWSSSSMTTELRRYVEQNLIRDSFDYITGSLCSHDQVMYVSSAEVQCTGGGVFPLEGIDADDIMMSLTYDELGNDRMYHLVDVTTCGFQIFRSDVSLVNSLSDGSSLYDTIYLSDWDSKGVWLFSNDVQISFPGNYLMHFPNLSPLKIRRMRQRYEDCPNIGLQFWYDEGVFRAYTSYSQGVAYGLKMTVRFHGTVQGYVQTDPKGIWGAVQDNYCSATFDNTLKGVPLAGFADYVSMDGGAVKAAMDAIYAQTFEDKKDGKKFQHSAHPVSMECTVDVYVEDENGKELFPMRVSWEYPYVTYYHAQDAQNYTCRMDVSVPRFSMVHVRPVG